jgi:hypothetical protein
MRNPEILDAADGLGLAGGGFQGIDSRLARLRRRKRLDGRRTLRFACLQQRADFRIELISHDGDYILSRPVA